MYEMEINDWEIEIRSQMMLFRLQNGLRGLQSDDGEDVARSTKTDRARKQQTVFTKKKEKTN